MQDGAAPAAMVEPCNRLVRAGRLVWHGNQAAAMVSRQLLVALLRPVLVTLRFDAAFYRRQYPDLAAAEAAGTIADLHTHYLEFGYFEDRLPCFVEVDAAFYGREYPDVAAGILDRTVRSAQWHFETFGFREGRSPRRHWRFTDLVATQGEQVGAPIPATAGAS